MKLSWSKYTRSEHQALAIHTTAPELNTIEHEHEFDELVIVDHGSGTHVINGRPTFIQAGDVYYVRQGDSHYYDDLHGLSLTNLLWSEKSRFTFIPPIQEILRVTHAPKTAAGLWLDRYKKPLVSNILEELTPCLAANDLSSRARCEGLILHAISLLSSGSPRTESMSGEAPHQVDRLLQFLRTHCTENIEWDWVCQRFGISSRNLFRVLKRETGHTPDSYITHLRLCHAKAMLIETDNSVTDIAYECGFGSPSYFCRVYRTTFGYSPSEQRKVGA